MTRSEAQIEAEKRYNAKNDKNGIVVVKVRVPVSKRQSVVEYAARLRGAE